MSAHAGSAELHDHARRTLQHALQHYGGAGGLAVVSAFGPGSAVLFQLLADIGARLPVIFIDTLHHFAETLEHVEVVRARYDLDLRVFRPAADLAAFVAAHGEKLWQHDLDTYQRITKVEPFRRASSEFDACITGRRRDQSAARTALPHIEPGAPTRYNPLALWSRADVWHYIRAHQLPYNVLHDRGYSSIGDAPLTTPTAADEHERAGRWRGTDRVECGIHLVHHRRHVGC